jgi:hypothetical protein
VDIISAFEKLSSPIEELCWRLSLRIASKVLPLTYVQIFQEVFFKLQQQDFGQYKIEIERQRDREIERQRDRDTER